MKTASAVSALAALLSLAAFAAGLASGAGLPAALSAGACLAASTAVATGLAAARAAAARPEPEPAAESAVTAAPAAEPAKPEAAPEEPPASAAADPGRAESALGSSATLVPFLDALLAAIPATTEEATFALIEKYETVRSVTTRAAALARSASERASAADGNSSIIERSRETVQLERRAVQMMAGQTRENTKKMRVIAKELEEGLNFVKGIEEITDRAQLIAFNMAIEAAHIGVQGRGFKVIVGELKNLNMKTLDFSKEISGLFERFSRYTAELIDNMAQQSDEVIVDLEKGMSAAESAVESIIDASKAADGFSRELAAETLQIDSALDGILEALQFQDISRQMVEQSRVILREMSGKMGELREALGLGPEPDPATRARRMEETRERLVRRAITRAEREAITEVTS